MEYTLCMIYIYIYVCIYRYCKATQDIYKRVSINIVVGPDTKAIPKSEGLAKKLCRCLEYKIFFSAAFFCELD